MWPWANHLTSECSQLICRQRAWVWVEPILVYRFDARVSRWQQLNYLSKVLGRAKVISLEKQVLGPASWKVFPSFQIIHPHYSASLFWMRHAFFLLIFFFVSQWNWKRSKGFPVLFSAFVFCERSVCHWVGRIQSSLFFSVDEFTGDSMDKMDLRLGVGIWVSI